MDAQILSSKNMQRNKGIDVIKLIFTVLVIARHSQLFPSQIPKAYMVVEAFFMLSGYMLYKTLKKDETLTLFKLMKKRVVRLYPNYIVAFFILNFTYYKLDVFTLENLDKSILEILMAQQLGFSAGGINYPAWYISVMFYGTIPIFLAYKYLKKKYFNLIAVICIVATYGYLMYCGNVEIWIKAFNIFVVPFWRGVSAMLLGIIIAQLKEHKVADVQNIKIQNVFQVIVLIGNAILITQSSCSDIVLLFSMFLLVVTATTNNLILDKIGQNKFIEYICKYQYGMILNHVFIFSFCKKVKEIIGIHLPPIVDFMFILISVFIFSMVIQKILDAFHFSFKKHKTMEVIKA